ncbi:ornithine decarboxylase antizyme-domain-containing protein [Protomyces lactucae-debilis]|uniref:Ornithine decarboxylase antizyme n=1 Tax=Protomyces lactucae-debilis TaxID=2754530 RepID=A0A1Y2FLI6_PROLT|nr:ornithine decarboxylase antizyme-domain-containing protein [Protomyces lactucae-debilis]ORY84214.1 ornithine decarboxylase antizyme-domain-containing protein [Protomyces lactucae-debilis]
MISSSILNNEPASNRCDALSVSTAASFAPRQPAPTFTALWGDPGGSAAGDVASVAKSCAKQQATFRSAHLGERQVSLSERNISSWYTQHIKLEKGEIQSEVVIKEEGKVSMTGVIEVDAEGDRTLYVTGSTNIQLKDGLVVLLDLALDCLQCQHLVIAIDRQALGKELPVVLHDLSWVGFTPIAPQKILKDAALTDKFCFVALDL